MRLRAPLLLLFLLAAAAAELGPRGGAGVRGEGRLRLCGRAFVRAVIFICGGSRWKRLPPGGRQEQRLLGGGAAGAEFLQEFLQSNSDKGMEDIKLEQLQHIGQLTGQQLLKRPFNFYGNYNAYVPTSDDLSQYIHQIQNAVQQSRGGLGVAKLMESNNFPWISSPRRKRDYSMGVSEMCCNWGCTKTEIGRLC